MNRKARKERKDKKFWVSLAFFAPFAVSNWLYLNSYVGEKTGEIYPSGTGFQQRVKNCCKLLLGYQTGPLINNITLTIQEEKVGQNNNLKITGNCAHRRIIYVQVDKFNLFAILLFKLVHDGHHTLARRSPKGEKFNQLRLARGANKGGRIAGA